MKTKRNGWLPSNTSKKCQTASWGEPCRKLKRLDNPPDHVAKLGDLRKVLLNFQVISARKGEFETGFERGGQTGEHAMLVKTAGVRKLIVVVNKMDDSTVNWDQNR